MSKHCWKKQNTDPQQGKFLVVPFFIDILAFEKGLCPMFVGSPNLSLWIHFWQQ